MYITIGTTDYTAVKALTFAPETDLFGDSVPINEFTADIVTGDNVSIGQYAALYDDLDNLWAKYWIVYAEHINAQTLRLRARSPLALIDRDTLPAVMYQSEPIADVLEAIFANTGAALGVYIYALDSSFSGATVTGFCPEQSARERLLWVCFAIGAYVKTFFTDKVEILPIDDTAELIPMDRTFWKPTVTCGDYVTAVTAKCYSFTQGTPSTTDKWVKDADDATYIVTEQAVTLANSGVPSGAPANVVTIDGVYLLNSGNVSGVLSHCSRQYFNRIELKLDAINNAEYLPGEKVMVYADDAHIYSGYIRSCDFSFGAQARASMRVNTAEDLSAAALTVVYAWGSVQVGRDAFLFPVGYAYSVACPYFDWTFNGHRYILRPAEAAVAGTMVSGGAEATVNCETALDCCCGVLEIISVDGAEITEGVVTIT